MELPWLPAVVTGVVTGVVVAYASFRLQASQEQKRWAREDRIRKHDLDLQANQRWLDDFRRLFALLLRQADDMREVSRGLYDREGDVADWSTFRADAYQTAIEIALVASDMEKASEDLFFTTHGLMERAIVWSRQADADEAQPPIEDREKASLDAYEAFFVAARAFLETHRMGIVNPAAGAKA